MSPQFVIVMTVVSIIPTKRLAARVESSGVRISRGTKSPDHNQANGKTRKGLSHVRARYRDTALHTSTCRGKAKRYYFLVSIGQCERQWVRRHSVRSRIRSCHNCRTPNPYFIRPDILYRVCYTRSFCPISAESANGPVTIRRPAAYARTGDFRELTRIWRRGMSYVNGIFV